MVSGITESIDQMGGAMNRRLFGAMCASVLLAAALPAQAQTARTAEEAVALVRKAADFYRANGRTAALAEFNSGKAPFVDNELYVFAIDMNGTIVANGVNTRAVGRSMLEMKDSENKYFIRNAIELVKGSNAGWVDYKWPNPNTRAMQLKSLYVEKVDDLIIGCGIFK
jgi:cytochrome c